MMRTGLQWTILSTAGAVILAAPTVFSQEAAEAGVGAVEEVMVTARRREESLQEVPGTVTALTQEMLERTGVQRADDFINLTPGVTMVDAAEVGDTQVNIRGINGARDAENSFAFIIDGVLYTNPAAFNREYTDLRQIEIFKGPQGAIYGRNAAAGAIIVTTTTPGNEREGSAFLSAADDDTYLAKGSVSGALIEDELYFRLSGDWRTTDGYYRNQYQNGAATVDALESYNINGRLVWEVSENLTIDSKLRVGSVDASSITFNSTFNLPIFAAALNNPPAYQDVNDFDFQFDANNISDNDQDALEFSTKFDQQLEDMTLTGWFLYSDIENDLMSDGTSAAFGFYNFDPVCQQTVSDLSGYPLLPPQFIGEVPIGVIFAPNGSFLGAYTPTTCDGIQEQLRHQKDYSFELRLASATDDPLQWMTGVYYLDIDRQVGVSLNRDSGNPPIRGLYQPEPGPNSTASLAWDDFDSEVFAVFGQIEYDISDDLELSFALRYDREKRKVSSLVDPDARQSYVEVNPPFNDGIINDPLNPGLSTIINPDGFIPDKSETYSETQPKVALRFDATDSTSLFASWGVGFKAGGFNNSGSAATVGIFINSFINCGNPLGVCYADQLGVPLPVINDDYKKETSSAFELGFSGVYLDGSLRVNGAAYYTEVTDMQFFEFFVGTFGLLRVVSNIDTVDIEGFELGLDYRLNDNWHFYAGVNWLDTEIKKNSSRPDTVGNQAPYTPEYTANLGVDFTLPMSNSLDFFTSVNASFVGETWFHTVQSGNRPTIFMPLFGLGFGPEAAGLGIAEYSVSRRDAYSLVDLRVGVAGDSWTLAAFATNLTDEQWLQEVIPAPEFGGSFDHPGSQRRYGVELSYRF
jgi:iron complex outermembrane receptor protein